MADNRVCGIKCHWRMGQTLLAWQPRCALSAYKKAAALGTDSAPSSLAALAIAVGFALRQPLGHAGDQPLKPGRPLPALELQTTARSAKRAGGIAGRRSSCPCPSRTSPYERARRGATPTPFRSGSSHHCSVGSTSWSSRGWRTPAAASGTSHCRARWSSPTQLALHLPRCAQPTAACPILGRSVHSFNVNLPCPVKPPQRGTFSPSCTPYRL